MPIPSLGMASYAYTAINASGLELDGEVNAPDAGAAREALRQRGLVALSLDEQAAASQGLGLAIKKVKPKSLQVFSRQFATMIEAGLNVVTALVILEEQTEDKKLAKVITELRADVEGGLLLSEAMARHPRIFSRLFISMVEAGEAAGILDVVLDRVAFQIEKETHQAPGQGGDDVPADGHGLRHARADRHAHVPRPDLRGHLRRAGW
jgi:type IV pilus assembly protein PilC